MRKLFKKCFVLFIIVGFLLPVSHAFTQSIYSVEVTSDKEEYLLGESVSFEVKIVHNNHYLPVNAYYVEATFPDDHTFVSLSEYDQWTLEYETVLNQKISSQTLNIAVYLNKNKKKLVTTAAKTICGNK